MLFSHFMNKLNFLLITLLLISTNVRIFAQQKAGKYKPTKYDSVKKVIPPQYYGNARDAKRADSIAKAEILQKELELKEKAEKEALEKKIAEKKLLDEKNKKNVNKNAPAVNEKKITEKKTQPAIITQPVVRPQQQRNIVKPNPVVKKKEVYKPEKLTKGIWTLEDCIAYAKLNNLQVAEAQLNERYAQLLYEESKNSRYPDLNADTRVGRAFGRNIDPATNQFVNNNFTYNTVGVYSQTLLFGWFQKKYQIEKNELDVKAAGFENEQLRDDISLNITAGFMRVLQAREHVTMTEGTVRNTNQQAENANRNYNADNTSKLQLASILASDSARYLDAKVNERIALLELKALMNFDFSEELNIQATENDAAQIAHYFSLPDAETLFNNAMQEKKNMQYQELKLMSAKKSLDIAKAMQYPRLSLYGGLGTVYSSNIQNITGQTYEGELPAGYVNIDGTSYPVTSSQYNYSTQTRALADQYNDHARANIGVGITIPLLNGYASRANIQRAKIGLVKQQMNMDSEKLKLKQHIYKTYEEAKAASQKYIAYKKAADESARFLEALNKGNNNDREFLNEKEQALNTFNINQLNAMNAKYDLLFKLKMLDYYTGNPLKL